MYWRWYDTIYWCCYKWYCENDGSCVVGYVGMVVYLVGGPRVKLIGCELGFLWTYGLCEFCYVVIV